MKTRTWMHIAVGCLAGLMLAGGSPSQAQWNGRDDRPDIRRDSGYGGQQIAQILDDIRRGERILSELRRDLDFARRHRDRWEARRIVERMRDIERRLSADRRRLEDARRAERERDRDNQRGRDRWQRDRNDRGDRDRDDRGDRGRNERSSRDDGGQETNGNRRG